MLSNYPDIHVSQYNKYSTILIVTKEAINVMLILLPDFFDSFSIKAKSAVNNSEQNTCNSSSF